MEEKFFKILDLAIRNGASDIHLLEKLKPLIRVNSDLFPLPGVEELSDEESVNPAGIYKEYGFFTAFRMTVGVIRRYERTE